MEQPLADSDTLDEDTPYGRTQQFPVDAGACDEGLSPSYATARHSAKDPTILMYSKAKRLPLASAITNAEEYRDARAAGTLLFEAFCRARNLPTAPVPFNEELFVSCIEENDVSKLTKKARTFIIANANKRNCPDWRHTWASIFPKDQAKCNAAKLFSKAYACQTIAQMQDQWLLLWGPVIRYMTKQHDSHCPENVLVLAGKTNFEAAEWAKRHVRGTAFTTNDYTKFDQSQGAEALYSEVMHLRLYSVPEALIQLYVTQKLNLQHQFGPSAIMRFSGEAATYKFNTLFSESLMHVQYDLGAMAYGVSGDDSLIIGHPEIRSSWRHNEKLFKIVAKTERPEQPEFCGFIYSRYGIVREPRGLAFKLRLAHHNKALGRVLTSYAMEYAQGLKLGDYLHEVLTERQLEYHAAAGHFMWDRGAIDTRAVLSTFAPFTAGTRLRDRIFDYRAFLAQR